MSIELQEARAPEYLKLAFYGMAGSGKTYTAARVLSEFIKEYAPDLQLAMYDTEGGAGFIKDMVRDITGKPLMAIAATSFAELKDFIAMCPGKYVGFIDSATHPWRTLCEDYLEAKRSRVAGAGGNIKTVRLALPDWGPIKAIWNQGFSDPYKFLPAHLCYCGRCGDVWETKTNDEGEEKIEATGKKMKIEAESAYEPSLLVEMIRVANPEYKQKKSTTQWLHRAEIVKDRSNLMNGKSANDPNLDFFRPHIDFLVDGEHRAPNKKPAATFGAGKGKNWETIKRERKIALEEIKGVLLLAFPGRTTPEIKAKTKLIQDVFGTTSWTAIESNEKLYTTNALIKAKDKLTILVKESQEPKKEDGK